MKNPVYWIRDEWPGCLAIVSRPRGNDWLEDEVTAWRQADLHGIVSMLEADEAAELGLSDEAAGCQAAGLEFFSFSIVDRSVPVAREPVLALAAQLAERLQQGRNIGIHCRQSVGRSSLLAACVLLAFGLDLEDALQRIAAARGCEVPETPQQYEWLKTTAKSHREML